MVLGLVLWEKIVSWYCRPVYRDIVECSQAGDGPWYLIRAVAQPSGTTRRRGYWRWWQLWASTGSAADALNALAVLWEWLQESISFHLIAELENYIVSCHWLF